MAFPSTKKMKEKKHHQKNRSHQSNLISFYGRVEWLGERQESAQIWWLCQKPHQVQDLHGTSCINTSGLGDFAPSTDKIAPPPSKARNLGYWYDLHSPGDTFWNCSDTMVCIASSPIDKYLIWYTMSLIWQEIYFCAIIPKLCVCKGYKEILGNCTLYYLHVPQTNITVFSLEESTAAVLLRHMWHYSPLHPDFVPGIVYASLFIISLPAHMDLETSHLCIMELVIFSSLSSVAGAGWIS